MAYASITYTSASGTTFALTNSSGDAIPYLRQSDISVTVNGVLKTLTTDYTFNTAGTSIVLNTSVSGASVVIARVTDIADATVTYTAGSTLTAQDLNNADNQIRYGLQEFSDTYGALTTGTGDLSALAGFIGSSETWTSDNAHTATTGAIDNRVDSKITTNNATVVLRDGSQAMQAALSLGGFKVTNLATPTSNTDASTKAYVDSNVGSVSASATAAAASASAAATSASNASTSASAASASQSAAASSASSASTSASNASTSASSASTSASNASTSATNAATSATSAASSAASALAAFDSFDDRYLGSKASDPTVDNDGDPLNAGDIYFNTTLSIMRVYTGTAWVAAYVPGDAVNISFTPYSTIAATNVQNAVQELTDEKLNLTGGTLTGALVNPLGSAAAPSLTFTGDTNTGIYSPGADQVAISSSGVNRLHIGSDGKIGVGTSPSTELLTVNGRIQSQWNVFVNGGTTSYAGDATSLVTGASAGMWAARSDSALLFAIGSSEKARLDSSGRLGVGTSSPTTSLQIGSGSGLQQAYISGGGYDLYLGASGGSAFGFASQAASLVFTNSTVPLCIGTLQSQPLAFGTTNSERLRITSAGLVGIGNNAPGYQLQVTGAGGSVSTNVVTNSCSVRYSNANTTAEWAAGTNAPGIENAGNYYSITQFGTDSTWRERFRIDNQGRCGIGSNSPAYSLDIVGDLRVTNSAGGTIIANRTSNPGSVVLQHSGTETGQVQAVSGGGLNFYTGSTPTLKATLDNSGRLLVGTSSARGVTPFPQDIGGTNSGLFSTIEGLGDGATQGLTICSNGTTNFTGAALVLARTRATTVGGNTLVANGDSLGTITFSGGDGNGILSRAAQISCYVDGTPGANDMPGRLTFSTTADGAASPTERMRISNGGAVSVNTTQTSFYLNVAGTASAHFGDSYDGTNYGSVQIGRPSNQNDDRFHLSFIRVGQAAAGMGFLRNSSTLAVINSGGTNGSGVTLASNATSWGTTSDERKKKVAGHIADGLDKIADWRCVYFSYLNESEDVRRVGLIAQDVKATLPEAVSVEEDELGTLQLRYTEILPVLVKALQESKERIETLEAKVAALEAA